jgi:hypothetical protein
MSKYTPRRDNLMSRGGSHVVSPVLAGALFIGAAALVLYLRLPLPFIWIWLVALPILAFTAVKATTGWGRLLSLVGFGLSVSMGMLEVVFTTLDRLNTTRAPLSGTYTQGSFFVDGGDLGYAPAPGSRVTAKRTMGDYLVFDVAYTISKEGVRVTRGNRNGDTWLFMGCSYMFGEGVNDDETLPAYFSAELGYGANVVNLGFPGYGPHQMLRSLETDRLRPLVGGPVQHVVYEGLWDHPWRAAGHDSWDFEGPYYALSENGVTYAGPFHDRFVSFALRVLKKSTFFQFVLDRTLYRPHLSDDDIERYARILERSAQLARERFGAGFTMVYWDVDNEPSRRVLARLRRTSLALVLVSDIIPRGEWTQLAIPGDGHPKPEANRRMAAALAPLLRRESVADGVGAAQGVVQEAQRTSVTSP